VEGAAGLAIAAYVVACAVPIGWAPLWHLLGEDDAGGARLAASVALGLGVQAYALTLLGAVGLFHPTLVLATPLALAVVTLPFAWRTRAVRWRPPHPSLLDLVMSALVALIGIAVVVSDLAPPSDYDGLLYHLVAPRAYLDAGRLIYIPHNFSANLPALGEMVFAIGLAAGSDRAPQLIHAAAGALSTVLTYFTARLLLPRDDARWAAVAFMGTPLVPFLMTRAYIDLFTVAFAALATWTFAHWLVSEKRGALVVCGVALGLAISTKYAALTAAAGVGITLLAVAAKRRGIRNAAACAAVTGGAALAGWLPWLMRQTLVLGNPAWPMFIGGRDWDAARVAQLTYFVSQYGSGSSLVDWILLPVNVFRESWRFGHVPWSFPPPIAVAAPLALADRRPVARWLLLAAGIAALLWARGWQDLRFLLTVYPLLALLGVVGLRAALPGPAATCAITLLVCGSLAATLTREGQRAASRLPVIVGVERPDDFVRREVSSHAAVTFLNATASTDSSVLFLGAGPVWYCRPRCIPDPAHDNLLVFFLGGEARASIDTDAALARLRAERIAYVLLSKVDFWYLEHQDPEARLKRQLAEFYVFKARHLDPVYDDETTEVYRLR
jgi:hypothetical protein